MAAKTPKAPAFEPDTLYAVQLLRVVTLSTGEKLSPGKRTYLKGKVLNELAPDDFSDAEPV